MRFLVTCILVIVFAASADAQIDSKKKSGAIIPAIEAPKDSTDSKKIAPEKLKKNDKLSGLKSPQVVGKLELPKKEFSMFPQEEFGNPGELYSKRLGKLENETKPEGYGEFSGLKNDAFWGDYHTKSKFIRILLRDYSEIDGDLLRIYVNGDVIKSSIFLNRGYSSLKLKLEDGLNEIIFQAVNTGDYGPNTAEYRIVDADNKKISNKVWALEKGVKVTVFIVKE